jgi:hypothetical protein
MKHTRNRRKAKFMGHNLGRKCLLKLDIEGKIREKERRGRRRKQLLDDIKDIRRYWKFDVVWTVCHLVM